MSPQKLSVLREPHKSSRLLNLAMWIGFGGLANCWLWTLNLAVWPDPAVYIPAWAWAAFAGVLTPIHIKSLLDMRRDPFDEQMEDARQTMLNTYMATMNNLVAKMDAETPEPTEKPQNLEQ
ncbi:MAG: hypothetical protein J1E80_06710 [Desulfovibrionaceae bacterium]|nr:hypothetical protein [Desulfovibrionaceae bacterium]